MKFFSLQPFVPSGTDFDKAKEFFVELGFTISWYVGFAKDDSRFILQKFNNREFAENFMLTVGIENADEFKKEMADKKLAERFGIRIGEVADMPYGREVNIIDMAGVCWHFVQQS